MLEVGNYLVEEFIKKISFLREKVRTVFKKRQPTFAELADQHGSEESEKLTRGEAAMGGLIDG